MKKGAYRFCSAFLAVLILSVAVVPAYAADTYTSTGSFWQNVARKKWLSGFLGSSLIGWVCDDVCSESPDKKHHGSLKSYEQNPDKSYTAICDFCSSEFPVYDADLSAAYNDYVQTLPAPGYTSGGAILWSPEVSYVFIFSNSYRRYCSHYNSSVSKPYDECISVFNCSDKTILLRPNAGANSFFQPYVELCCSGEYPIDGYYKQIKSLASDCTYIDSSVSKSASFFYDADAEARLYYAGVHYDFSRRVANNCTYNCQHASYSYYLPVYEVVPFNSGVGQVNNTYNINTRPTSITGGNYGIVGDNGQITKVEDNSTIINETNNTYYNPATGQTVPITGWSYDYSDRSYKVTLESGDTVTVTYGDENITIQEGDTIYNVYYLIDGSGSETPVDPPAACEHTWTETSTPPATCTMPGSKLLTCSKCQQTKTETIPALGHDWQVKQSVTTEYDDTGQLVQKGYTIFECSRCGEQYKSEDGTGPPDTPPEDPGEEEEKKGFFSWLWSVLTDALKKLIEGIIDAILKTLDFFFGGDSQSNYDFYNSPSTFSGVSVWGS